MGGGTRSDKGELEDDPDWGPELEFRVEALNRLEFTILRKLKDSLFGCVYRAKINGTEAVVAIKESSRINADGGNKANGGQPVLENLRDEVRACLRLQRAARVMARLDDVGNDASEKRLSSDDELRCHPGLLELVHFMGDENHYWTVFEFCQGSEFFEFIANCHPTGLSNSEAARLFRQLIVTLAFIHDNDLCHLDVSLENAMITDAGDLKVIDFGVARLLKRDKNGEILPFPGVMRKPGKMQYMAPELFEGAPWYGHKADMWSAGVMLFVMLCGVPPFRTATRTDQCFRLIIGGKLTKLLEAWRFRQRLSPQAIDLLSNLLCPDTVRLTAHQALKHPWIAED